jgi:hypothetical protein
MCLFDSILGGKKHLGKTTLWVGKDYEEAINFAEVSFI